MRQVQYANMTMLWERQGRLAIWKKKTSVVFNLKDIFKAVAVTRCLNQAEWMSHQAQCTITSYVNLKVIYHQR